MYIKIYFNNKPLFLCDAIDEELEPFVHHDDAVFIDELDGHTVKSMIHEMQSADIHAGVFFHPDLEKLKKEFFKKFTLVSAAGGLVYNPGQEMLMIFRRGSWDLPKGKLDPGETLEECAVREVQEETGLKNVTLLKPLAITYHTYHEGSKFILKDSHWYTMKTGHGEKTIPQTEEDIQEIKWVNNEGATALLPACFPSVRDVLKLAMKQA